MTSSEAQTYAPAPQPESVVILDVDSVSPSKTNPRKHNKKPDPEFVESVRVHGVLQPIVVVELAAGGHEIVFGEMRWQACRAAERAEIPAIVRTMERDEIFEVQVIENSQRKDVHPLDESDAFAELVKRGYELQRIADRIGRPLAYVAQRLKLRELGKAGREALDEERISLAVALQIARIPGDKLQAEAIEEVGGQHRGRDDEGFRETLTSKGAAKAIRERFMLRLVDAKFDKSDVTLVAKAGPCTTCPKRTGNQGELFADVDSPDLCTDPTCFRSKNDAQWRIIQADAKKSGRAILDDKEAKKLWPYEYSSRPNGAFHQLDDEVWGGAKQVKVKALVAPKGADAPETTLARNPHTGQIVELVSKALVERALKARQKGKGGESSDDAGPERKKLGPAEKAKVEREKLKQKAAGEVARRLRIAAAEAIVKLKPDAADELLLPLLLSDLINGVHGTELTELAVRRGIEKGKGASKFGWEAPALEQRAAVEGPAWTRGLLLELALSISLGPDGSAHSERGVEPTLKALGVDRKAIEAEVLANLKAGTPVDAKPGTCRECGCTDTTPCTDKSGEACAWTDATHTLCSACPAKGAKARQKPKAKKK